MGRSEVPAWIGRQIGPYRLVRMLGEGGMGRVFLAEHTVMGDHWAIKLLADDYVHRPDIVARFMDEARAAARVRHRNLVRVFHVEQSPDGTCYMVLEYLEGESLSRFVALNGPAAPHFVLRLAARLSSALRALHQHGIIHRDIKPDNVMLVAHDGDRHYPKLLDLGVAHLGRGLASGPGTQAGIVIGTPAYMPPEQLLGDSIGPSADLFSLGVLVYELATGGRLPWQREDETRADYGRLSPTAVYRRQEKQLPVDPRRHVPSLSDGLAKALLAPLAFEPSARPADERAYVIALAQAVPGDELAEDGLAIVRSDAPDLLISDDVRETVRTAAPSIIAPPGSEARYVLGEKLGEGGMAEVFAAQAIGVAGFERPVAIKRVLPELSAQPAFASMFISEARIASRLSHPNIVSVTDFRKDDQGRLFLVMEHIDGKDLATLAEATQLSPSAVIYIMVEMLRGLGYAHARVDPVSQAQGVIHRDVSPHNVLISREGEVKIGDFGLSRAGDAAGRARSGTIRGKAAYMAPEQVRGDVLDRRTDLFAAGIILWELLARAPLFSGSSSETMASVLFKDIVPPSAERPGGVPADLEAVAMKLLERSPDERFQTAEDAIATLLRCADARLDSRDELVRVVRACFPRPGEALKYHETLATVASGPKQPERATAPARSSTLGGAASQSVPDQRPRGPGRAAGLALLGGATAVAAAVIVGLSVAPRLRGAPASPVLDAGAAKLALGAVVTSAPADAGIAPGARTDAAASMAALPDTGLSAPSDDHAAREPSSTAAGTGATPFKNDTGRPGAPSRAQRPAGRGELAIIVKPWAAIWLDGKQVGHTPYRARLPAGRHRLRLANEDVGKDESFTITIAPDKTTAVERTWR